MTHFRIDSRAEYYGDLVRRLRVLGAGDRAVVATMALTAGEPAVRQVFEALGVAARHGADVRLVVDAFAFMFNSQTSRLGPLVWGREPASARSGPFGDTGAALRELEAAGGRYVLVNRPRRVPANPYGGRSHMKYAVINDDVWVGGCNFDNSDHLDLMVGWRDQAVAKLLVALTDRLFATGSARLAVGDDDVVRAVAPGAWLLLDAGVAGRSVIYDRALALIDAAQEWIVMTCQYFPNGETARRLLAAHRRGVMVKILFNDPGKHAWPHNLAHRGVMTAGRLRLPPSFFEHVVGREQAFLHAKLLASERAAMIGSHNYVPAGVRLGTAEMALEVAGPEFADRAVAKIWDLVDSGILPI
ncbi:MAG TPA: phospholipase D-like domain-containing protein [Candidatus Saccharimonadia bacterium]|nr:phospholipase D-like domain-containing protein [Candidatus Saccharimonadia bacterium]